MKRWMILMLRLFWVPSAVAADLAKARQEGRANLYANITAVEPIMEAFFSKTLPSPGWSV